MQKRIAIICGARPNMMKVLPLCRELAKQKIPYFLVHTNQHFDYEMSRIFLNEFKISPKYQMAISRGSSIHRGTDIMRRLERIFLKEKPCLVVVVGDVDSTLYAALAAEKMNIRLAHIEAGLRSYNEKMPEEINRVIVDHISDLLFVTAEEGLENLRKEGINNNVYFVGNIMIDTLMMFLPRIPTTSEPFYFCTLHRAENVDNPKTFKNILDALFRIKNDQKIYLPLHPRAKKAAKRWGLASHLKQIFEILPPISYTESLFYQKNAKLILTDSGGIQEEASFLGIPCITLRTETERPITVKRGTNSIGGVTKDSILKAYKSKHLAKKKISIPLWDGKASKRIVTIIKKNI